MLEQLGLTDNALILFASLIFLALLSHVSVKNAAKVSALTGFGKTTVGFILVAFAASLPELSVAVFGVISGNISLSIGNILGSNIVSIALGLGLCFLVVTLKCPKFQCVYPVMAKEEIGNLHFGLFVASIIPLTLLYIGYASQFIGVILLAVFLFYMFQLSRADSLKDEGALNASRNRIKQYALLALAGAAGVIASAYFIVHSASFIATSLGVPRVIIGATVVAFGANMPELATAVNSVRKGRFSSALGNIVRSCFINVTCILGIALIASPLTVNIAAFSNVAVFSLVTNLFLWYFLSSERTSWREATLLLVLYTVFLYISFSTVTL